MATKIGTRVLIKLATKILVGQNSLSYAKAVTMIEVSSKTSGKHSEFESGRISETISVSGIASSSKEATAAGYWECYDAVEAGVPVSCTFVEYTTESGSTEVVGAEKMTVSCLLSNLKRDDPDNAASTFSVDLQITGAPVRQIVAQSGAPVCNAGPNQTVNEGATVTLDASASTNGGSGTLSYLWTPPTGITLSSNTIVDPTFTAPSVSAFTEYEFSLQVYNGTYYSTIDKVVITVLNV